jgi:hypothetical protein
MNVIKFFFFSQFLEKKLTIQIIKTRLEKDAERKQKINAIIIKTTI